ncbi:MAG: acyltransferase family protein, partial [Frateuria sp.]
WGHAWLNRPFRWLPYAREAVYPWYVLHQSVLLFAAWQLMPLGLGPVLEPLSILLATILGCALLHHLVIRPSRWLRPLFGLEGAPARRPARPTVPVLSDDVA